MERVPASVLVPAIVRWVARIVGTLTALLVLVFLLAYALGDEGEGGTAGLQAAVFLSIFILSVALAWKWERVGGVLLLINSVVFLIVETRGIWPPTPLTLFPVCGVLFLVSWFGRRTANASAKP